MTPRWEGDPFQERDEEPAGKGWPAAKQKQKLPGGLARAYEDAYALVSRFYHVPKPALEIVKDKGFEKYNVDHKDAYAVAVQEEGKIVVATDVEEGLREYDCILGSEDLMELTMLKLLVHELLHFSPGNWHEDWKDEAQLIANESVTELVAGLLTCKGMKWNEKPASIPQVVFANLLYRPTIVYVVAAIIVAEDGPKASERARWLLNKPPDAVVDFLAQGVEKIAGVSKGKGETFLAGRMSDSKIRKTIFRASKKYTHHPPVYIFSLPLTAGGENNAR